MKASDILITIFSMFYMKSQSLIHYEFTCKLQKRLETERSSLRSKNFPCISMDMLQRIQRIQALACLYRTPERFLHATIYICWKGYLVNVPQTMKQLSCQVSLLHFWKAEFRLISVTRKAGWSVVNIRSCIFQCDFRGAPSPLGEWMSSTWKFSLNSMFF